MKIHQIRVSSFKNIAYIEFGLDDLNLLVGGNNSGKSSVIQGVHFAISALRLARLHGISDRNPATTLGLNQFTFLPTQQIMELNHSSPITQSEGPRFDFWYEDDSGEEQHFWLSLSRGKNANIALKYPKDNLFFNQASDLHDPFSVYVPGLAGVPLIEERRANTIVQSGIALGDSNLFLRNVLHRLEGNPRKKSALENMMRSFFADFSVSTTFDENVNQYISTRITLNGKSTPLEMAGTGCLQALQLTAYVILYQPKLLLLDEPDAHLHPGNQKLLVDLLFSLAEANDTQIILASHSRHVFDSVNNNPLGNVLWLNKGALVEETDIDVGLLIELGALDKFEEIRHNRPDYLVFSEDEKTQKLKILLESNGWDLKRCQFVSFNGVDNFEATRVVLEYFLEASPKSQALIYRDGDCMTPEERAWALQQYQKNLPERANIFISHLTDIEHFFCQPGHISTVCQIDEMQAIQFVEQSIDQMSGKLTVKMTQKRADLKNKLLKNCPDRKSTEDLISHRIGFHYCLGKILLPIVETNIRKAGIKFNSLQAISADLAVDELNFEAFLMSE